jgi:hypothetical protein
MLCSTVPCYVMHVRGVKVPPGMRAASGIALASAINSYKSGPYSLNDTDG